MSLLITVDELAERLASSTPPVLLDVRWRLDRTDGEEQYLAGHIQGAVYVDLDDELAAHGLPATEGRHPLPTVDALQAAARRWGIDRGSEVVVYDDLKNLSSARAWWLLRYAGVENVRLLDGSLRAWTSAGHPLESGAVTNAPGDVTLEYGKLPTLTADQVAEIPSDGILLDARAAERYRGETEPIDPRAGHIPGARNSPTTQNVDADGRFLPADQLRERFTALGATTDRPLATYCGSGVTAAHNVVALTLAGFEPALFPGSWSAWSSQPARPVAVGDENGVEA